MGNQPVGLPATNRSHFINVMQPTTLNTRLVNADYAQANQTLITNLHKRYIENEKNIQHELAFTQKYRNRTP